MSCDEEQTEIWKAYIGTLSPSKKSSIKENLLKDLNTHRDEDLKDEHLKYGKTAWGIHFKDYILHYISIVDKSQVMEQLKAGRGVIFL